MRGTDRKKKSGLILPCKIKPNLMKGDPYAGSIGAKEKSDIFTESSHEGKYLTFVLCGEEYGIEILKVREIIGIMNITPVPQTPGHIKG